MQSTRTYLIDRLGVVRADAILSYLKESGCDLKICKARKTKLGDFRVRGDKRLIKVNDGMNQYRFILTLIHEIAHLKTYLEFKSTVQPHGTQWKQNYRQLMAGWKISELFSNTPELMEVYRADYESPKACAGIHMENERKLSQFDEGETGLMLHELQIGDEFLFRNVPYKKMETRRTRVLCLNLKNQRLYTIHKASQVEQLQY